MASPPLIAGTVVALVGGALAVALGPEGAAQLTRGAVALGGWAPVALVPMTVLLSCAAVPAPLLAVAAGAICGPIAGAALAQVAFTVAAVVQMLTVRRFGVRVAARVRLRERFASLDRGGAWAVAAAQLVPGAPFVALNLAAGLTRLRARDLAAGVAVGKAPGTLGYAAVGAGAAKTGGGAAVLVLTSAITVLVLTALALRRRGWHQVQER